MSEQTVTRSQRNRALIGLSMFGIAVLTIAGSVAIPAATGDYDDEGVYGLLAGIVLLVVAFFVLPRANDRPVDPRKRKMRIVAGVMILIAFVSSAANGGEPAPATPFLFFGGIALLVVAWIMNDQPAA